MHAAQQANKLKYGFANMTRARGADSDESDLDSIYFDEDVCDVCDGEGCSSCKWWL
jgi:hypothetical protein